MKLTIDDEIAFMSCGTGANFSATSWPISRVGTVSRESIRTSVRNFLEHYIMPVITKCFGVSLALQ